MKYCALNFIAFLLISTLVFGQQASKSQSYFSLSRQETVSQAVQNWYFFNNREVAISQKTLIIWENSNRIQNDLQEDNLFMVYSANGRYHAMAELNPLLSLEPINRQLNILVYNSEREKLFTIHRKHYYDRMFPVISISDRDGAVVLGESDTGEIWFYDNNGFIRNHIILFPEAEYDLERVLQFQWSGDGSKVAVLASKRGSAPVGSNAINPDGEPHLFLFNANGDQLWKMDLPEMSASSLIYSANGNEILVNNFTVNINGDIMKKALVYNAGGEQVFETDILYKYADFTADSKYLILGNNQQIRVFDLEKKSLLWQQKIPREQGMITTVKTTHDAKISLVLTGKNEWNGEYFIFRQPQVKIFNRAGELFQDIDVSKKTFRQAALWISPGGELFKLGFDDSFSIYTNRQK